MFELNDFIFLYLCTDSFLNNCSVLVGSRLVSKRKRHFLRKSSTNLLQSHDAIRIKLFCQWFIMIANQKWYFSGIFRRLHCDRTELVVLVDKWVVVWNDSYIRIFRNIFKLASIPAKTCGIYCSQYCVVISFSKEREKFLSSYWLNGKKIDWFCYKSWYFICHLLFFILLIINCGESSFISRQMYIYP